MQDRTNFRDPSEAQLFALTVHLSERGAFTWPEWTRALSAAIAKSQDRDGGRYFECWYDALADLLESKSIAGRDAVEEVAAAWRRAARATPHGAPVRLENDPGPDNTSG